MNKRKSQIMFILFFITSCNLNNYDTSVIVEPDSTTLPRTPIPNSVVTSTSIIQTLPNTLVPQPTPTSFPAVSETDPIEFAKMMIETNGGCKFPCVLGLMPEDTNSVEVRRFLGYFSRQNFPFNKSNNTMGIDVDISYKQSKLWIQFLENKKEYNFSAEFKIESNNLTQATLNFWVSQSSNGSVRFLNSDSYFNSLFSEYTLYNILNSYGIPSKILIGPFPDDPDYPNARYIFPIVLFYEEKGIIIQYLMPRVKEGQFFVGCPTQASIGVVTWNPKKDTSIEQIVNSFSGVEGINSLNINYFKPLDETSDFNLSTFYEKFKTISDSCIKTPKEIWVVP